MTETTATTTDPAALLAVYRARRELAVTQPQGNLALVNTQWITGDADAAGQAVWGVPGLWSPLPEGQSGLKVTAAASDNIVVDGEVVEYPKHMAYKGIMLSDVPNMLLFFGYTNASWTLKVDLTYAYAFRLIKHIERAGLRQFTPRFDPAVEEAPFLDFSSGYVVRALDKYPKQGATQPWRLSMNYAIDAFQLRFTKLEDGAMEFSNPKRPSKRSAAA